jgi:hypothetical protein
MFPRPVISSLLLVLLASCQSVPSVSTQQPFASYLGKRVALVEEQIVVKVPPELHTGVVPLWLVSVAEFKADKGKSFQYVRSLRRGDKIRIVRVVPIQCTALPGSVLYTICEVPSPTGIITCELSWGACGVLFRAPWEPLTTPAKERRYDDPYGLRRGL